MTCYSHFPCSPQVVTKPPEFERFSEFGESSLVESDSDYTEPMMYSNNERKDIFVIEVRFSEVDLLQVLIIFASGRGGLHPNAS